MTSIIGANGAGKSTILKAISGLVPLVSGEIHFAGERIDGRTPYHIVGLGLIQVPEGRRLFPHLSVLSNLKLGASLRQDGAGIKKDLEQMLAIARGLMARPKLLLLDEPSLGLAPKMVAELVPVIRQINARGVSVLLVEQNIPLAMQVADRAYALKVGQVVLEGSVEEFKCSDIVKRAYLGAA